MRLDGAVDTFSTGCPRQPVPFARPATMRACAPAHGPTTPTMSSFLDPQLVLELLLIGTCTGFLAGLMGIGGGMLMVPFVTMILTSKGYPPDYTVKMAVAASLSTICFTSLASVRAHDRRGAVLWPVVKVLAPGILVGSLLGAQ